MKQANNQTKNTKLVAPHESSNYINKHQRVRYGFVDNFSVAALCLLILADLKPK